jgi:hypothetical protein
VVTGMGPGQGVEMFFPLLLAVIGAAAGAYFAVIKTKREKLWAERYARLGAALEKANILNRYLDSEINGRHLVHGLTSQEKDKLDEIWPITRYELGKEVVMLQMLFSEADFSAALGSWVSLETALFTLIQEGSEYDGHNNVAKARPHAAALELSLITLSRKKCLGWF